MSRVAKQAGGALAMAALSFCYFAAFCDNARFDSDAADYITSAAKGFPSIYFDSGSITPAGMYSLSRKQSDYGSHLWRYLERARDPAAFRHFHVALSFYPYALAAALGAGDRGQRLVTASEGALVIAIAFFGLQSAGVGIALSAVASLLITLSPSVVRTFTDPSPHTLFLALIVAFGFMAGRFLETGSTPLMHAVAALLAVLFATLELSLIAGIAVLALAVTRNIPHPKVVWRDLASSSLVFLGALVFLWPGGFLRGGYLVSYGVFLFQALFRRGYFGNAGFSEVVMRATDMSFSIVIVLAGLIILLVFLFLRRRFNTYIEVFAWLSLGFALQGYLNKFHNATYVAHFTAMSWILFALSARRWIDTAHGVISKIVTAIAVIAAGVAAEHWPQQSHQLMASRDDFSRRVGEVMAHVSRNVPAGSLIVTNTDRAVWHHYLPSYRIEPSVDGRVEPLEPAAEKEYWVLTDPSLLRPGWRTGVSLDADASVGGLAVYRYHLQ